MNNGSVDMSFSGESVKLERQMKTQAVPAIRSMSRGGEDR